MAEVIVEDRYMAAACFPGPRDNGDMNTCPRFTKAERPLREFSSWTRRALWQDEATSDQNDDTGERP